MQKQPIQDGLYQRFKQQAKLYPKNIAICDESRSFTYQQLEQEVHRVAQQLYDFGVKPGDNVALLLPRSCELITQILATLRLGACYVPIDPDYPIDRINWIINRSLPAVLITQKQLSQTFWPDTQKINNKILYVEDKYRVNDKNSNLYPLPSADDNFAYIIFTSGTTGNPKGVAVGQKQVLALLDSAIPLLEAKNTDVWTLFHSLAFDFSVWELWGALTTGAKLVIVPKSVAWSAEYFTNFLRSQKVTILNQTPSAFYALIDAEFKTKALSQEALALRKVIFGGEALDLKKLQKWWQLYNHNSPELINMYGITETTVHVTWLPLNNELIRSDKSPIGKSLSSLDILLLDENLQQVKDGEIGEIYVAGQQLAYGYIGQPDHTATRFIASPFHTGQRLYRSGDLAMQKDDQLYYLGRGDRQLKIRGFRVEPEEIETVLEAHPAIQRAIILEKPCIKKGLPDGLLAFLQPLEKQMKTQVTKTELRTYVSKHLPAHYLPADFIFIDTLPLTVNGKLDQKQLLKQWHNKQTNAASAHQKRLQLLRAKQLISLKNKTSNLSEDDTNMEAQ